MYDKTKYYFITINLFRGRHKDLIRWIKEKAERDDRSISSFIISILKEKFAEDKNDQEKME